MTHEPTWRDVIAHIAMGAAEGAAYLILVMAMIGFGIATGWLG